MFTLWNKAAWWQLNKINFSHKRLKPFNIILVWHHSAPGVAVALRATSYTKIQLMLQMMMLLLLSQSETLESRRSSDICYHANTRSALSVCRNVYIEEYQNIRPGNTCYSVLKYKTVKNISDLWYKYIWRICTNNCSERAGLLSSSSSPHQNISIESRTSLCSLTWGCHWNISTTKYI